VNAAARRPRSHHYSVYVVELADRVWNVAGFRRANPDYRLGQPFVYVGMTGLDPDLRFDRHKAGIQANRFVRDYGLRLLPGLYEVYNTPFAAPHGGARAPGAARRSLGSRAASRGAARECRRTT
jgi:hypothetical protein